MQFAIGDKLENINTIANKNSILNITKFAFVTAKAPFAIRLFTF